MEIAYPERLLAALAGFAGGRYKAIGLQALLQHPFIPQRNYWSLRRYRCLLATILVLLGLFVVIGLLAGSYVIDWRQLLSADAASGQWQIITSLRLPRVIGAAVVGAALAVSGVLLQVLLRNPVADAGLMGITPAAAFVAVLWVAAWGETMPPWLTLPLVGAAGASAMTLVLLTAAVRGGVGNGERLVLLGVAAGALLTGLTAFVLYTLDDLAQRQVQFWLLGSASQISLVQGLGGLLTVMGLVLFIVRRAAAIDLMMLGELEARLAGVRVDRLQLHLLLCAALLAALAVALAGGIAFVGLLVPHLLRRLGCERHRQLLPLSALAGGALLMGADQSVRLAATTPVPLGVVTMVLGAPALLILLWRRGPIR